MIEKTLNPTHDITDHLVLIYNSSIAFVSVANSVIVHFTIACIYIIYIIIRKYTRLGICTTSFIKTIYTLKIIIIYTLRNYVV